MNTEHSALFGIGAKITYTQCLKTQTPCRVASAPLFIFKKKKPVWSSVACRLESTVKNEKG
jgi:hypothetical protein